MLPADQRAPLAPAGEMPAAGTQSRTAQVHLARAQACWHARDLDAADRAAQDALAADPMLTEAAVLRAWVATDRGDGETALACYRRLVELAPGAVRWWLKLAHLLNVLGHVEEALSTLKTINTRWPMDPAVRMFMQNSGLAAHLDLEQPDLSLQSIMKNAPDGARWLRPLIDSDAARDVLTAPLGVDSAVLVFTSSNDGLGMPLRVFDRYLATLPITCIYLKDFRRLRFLRGVRSLSEDYPGTLAALRVMLDDLGVKRLCTLGNCGGGFAAIRYGVEMGAERILAFEALTYAPDASSMKFEKGHNFSKTRLAAAGVDGMSDLKPFLTTREHPSHIKLFYGELQQHERIHALRLAGLPGVELCPQTDVRHHLLLRHLASSSADFSALLAALLGVGP
ncbi:MAG: hypothetical protein NVSMB10_08860 [Steroidobacteraceae bacterium]